MSFKNDITNTIHDEFKFNMISNFQTGNILIDTFIRAFIFTLITSITTYFINMNFTMKDVRNKITFTNLYNIFTNQKLLK